MRWVIQWQERYTLLRFESDLMAGATEFFETGVRPWLKTPFAPIILDLSDMTIIASAGLGCLIRIQKEAEQAGVHLVLVKPKKEAWRSLEITRLDRLFAHADTVEEAAGLLAGLSS